MAKKENKGGLLTNEQVEKDNRVNEKVKDKTGGYAGTQDTGINKPPEPDSKKGNKEKNKNNS